MKFKSISARNKRTGWNVENMQFNPMLTLLVGASGVGKTKILNIIRMLTRVARGESFNGFEWEIEFEQNGRNYVWEGEFGIIEVNQPLMRDMEVGNDEAPILREMVFDNGEEMIMRSSDGIRYKGNDLVKLDNAKSVVELLKEESSVKPIYDGFKQCYTLDVANNSLSFTPLVSMYRNTTLDVLQIKQMERLSPLEKLYLVRSNNLNEFNLICQAFQSIFPSVEKIDVLLSKAFDNFFTVAARIKEKGVEPWIEHFDISSGMFRTLLQITAMVMANDGDVIMIDEFENGLGVNCINELADLIMEPEANIQVLMTSHHPYIINAIPVKDWKILTRNGSDVHVHTAEELHIGEHSKHEAFMQLLQTREYKTGTRN